MVVNGEDANLDLTFRDFTRENAAYELIKAKLERDSMGKIALMHNDDLVGVYDDMDSAIDDGYRRFGLAQFMVREIGDPVYEIGFGMVPPERKPALNPLAGRE